MRSSPCSKWAGYEVAGIAASSEEVFAKVPELHPDLILMDIHIDGLLDGIQTAAKLLERFDILIVHLSAYTDPGDDRSANGDRSVRVSARSRRTGRNL